MDRFCIGPDGEEVQIMEDGDTGSEEGQESSEDSGVHCHFHAGVEFVFRPYHAAYLFH